MITPEIFVFVSSLTSLKDEIPPLATSLISGNLFKILLYSSLAVPCKVPSLLTSVQTTLTIPFEMYSSRKLKILMPEFSCQPLTAISSFFTSALRMILSLPYFCNHFKNNSLSFTAVLPIFNCLAPFFESYFQILVRFYSSSKINKQFSLRTNFVEYLPVNNPV
jgi:hypothetical protein